MWFLVRSLDSRFRDLCQRVLRIAGRAVVHLRQKDQDQLILGIDQAARSKCAAMAEAVSYTHLDVYKRQI